MDKFANATFARYNGKAVILLNTSLFMGVLTYYVRYFGADYKFEVFAHSLTEF